VVELEHPAAVEAVIEKMVVCRTFDVLTSVPDIGVPVPLAGIPVIFPVLSLVQLNVVPGIPFEERAIFDIVVPEHIV